jgi:hypothetical protein
MIWRLPSEASPTTIGLRPRPAGVLVGGGRHQRPVDLQPATLPLNPRKPFVCQIRFVTVGGYEGVCFEPLVGGGFRQPEGGDDAPRIDHQGHLEAIDPLGLGSAPAEGGLPAEQPLAGRPHPHDDGRDEGGVHHAVDGRRIAEFLGEGPLQGAQLGLQGSHPAVELALGAEVREVGAQVRGSEAPEIPLAAKAWPLGHDRRGDDHRVAEQCRTTRAARSPTMVRLPPIRTMRRGRSRGPCGTTFGRRFGASIEFRLLPRLPQLLISRLSSPSSSSRPRPRCRSSCILGQGRSRRGSCSRRCRRRLSRPSGGSPRSRTRR